MLRSAALSAQGGGVPDPRLREPQETVGRYRRKERISIFATLGLSKSKTTAQDAEDILAREWRR